MTIKLNPLRCITVESKPARSYHVEERLEYVQPSKMICAAQGLTGSASQNIWHIKKPSTNTLQLFGCYPLCTAIFRYGHPQTPPSSTNIHRSDSVPIELGFNAYHREELCPIRCKGGGLTAVQFDLKELPCDS